MARLTRSKRLEAVEARIRSEGWSYAIGRQLAIDTEWSERTIYRDRDAVFDKLADEEAVGLERRRARFLMDLRRNRQAAEDAGKFPAVARLLDMESKVLGLDRVPLPTVEEDPDEPVDTSLEYMLHETRKMRKQAQAGYSYIAANKLLTEERETVESIRLRDQAEAEAQMMHLDEEGIVGILTEQLTGLPEHLRSRILGALSGGE